MRQANSYSISFGHLSFELLEKNIMTKKLYSFFEIQIIGAASYYIEDRIKFEEIEITIGRRLEEAASYTSGRVSHQCNVLQLKNEVWSIKK